MMQPSIIFVIALILASVFSTDAFRSFPRAIRSSNALKMADVECVFPGNKKAKAAPGASLKEVAKKAGFTPNYGCEEGKCGSCELKVNGKTKIRPCIGKVPNAPSPIKFENL